MPLYLLAFDGIKAGVEGIEPAKARFKVSLACQQTTLQDGGGTLRSGSPQGSGADGSTVRVHHLPFEERQETGPSVACSCRESNPGPHLFITAFYGCSLVTLLGYRRYVTRLFCLPYPRHDRDTVGVIMFETRAFRTLMSGLPPLKMKPGPL